MAATPAAPDPYQEALRIASQRTQPIRFTTTDPEIIIELVKGQIVIKDKPWLKGRPELRECDMTCGHTDTQHRILTDHKGAKLNHALCTGCYLNITVFSTQCELLRVMKAQHTEQIRVLKLLVASADRQELAARKPEDYRSP